MPKVADELRAIFSSPAEINAETDKAIIEGITKTFPVEDAHYRIEVENVHAEVKKFDHRDEKDAILKGKSLTYPIRGTLKMYDKKTDRLVDTVKNFNLADSFALTGKHTAIYSGNNYNIANLIKLKPGVYTRSRDNDELESAFNTGSGANFSLILDPETLIFNIRAGSAKSAGVPILPILKKVFGIEPVEISRFVPKEILDENIKKTTGMETRAVQNLYSKMVNKAVQDKSLTLDEKAAALREAMENSTLNEMTTETTLGKSFTHVNSEVLMRAMKNLVDISKGDREEDNRDSLQFKKVESLPDFISSHFDKRHASVSAPVRLMTRGLSKVDKNNPSIRDAIAAKPFSKVFSQFLSGSSLATTPTETNPIESIENVAKATIIGPKYGGISSIEGVPDEARNIDPSHLGILDPSRTPESKSAGIDLRFTLTSRRDKEGNMYARTLDKSGTAQYLSVHEMAKSTIGFPDQMNSKSPTVMAQVNGKFKEVPRAQVDAWIPAGSDIFTATTNLVPYLNSNHPGRLA